MQTYSVWWDNQEQWDPDDIDEPKLRCQATHHANAAEQLADQEDVSKGTFIVRRDHDNVFRVVELAHQWIVKSDTRTTIEELSAP